MRVLTALVGVPALLAVAWVGGPALLVLLAVLAVLAAEELCRLLRKDRPHRGLAFVGVLALLAGAYFLEGDFPGFLPAALLLLYLTAMVLFFPRFNGRSFCSTLVAAGYPALLAYLYVLRVRPDGWEWVLFTLLATWAFDTLGYFVGLTLGRVRITPGLSPKKSLEGLIGGLAGAVLVAYVFSLVTGAGPLALLLVLGFAVAVGAQVGDLAASAFKRFADVKDAGRLLPGHGGVLDRFDSLLFSAPLAYFLINLLGVKMP
ncbi:MAG: phosphatidate cytidylyltransferase [Thermoanaerobacterales bacterium]|nr:phosphatidate cytidylyltransferase [Bacillota bacterium]MDI6907799.1 phosphatidate cytidylyltransferase [Thermoanaerobacterales bacterium]